jgi:hypothetical protein
MKEEREFESPKEILKFKKSRRKNEKKPSFLRLTSQIEVNKYS